MSDVFGNVPVHVIYSKRKTLSIEVRSQEILVRAPKGLSKCKIDDFINRKQDWILKQIEKIKNQKECLEKVQKFTINELKELSDKALTIIPNKVNKYAMILDVNYGKITIRTQRTRWGSCSSKGNLNFNSLLMLFPDAVIDYVVIHELCHRKHMNHSSEFYAEVERICPNYRQYQKWLKENGGIYIGRLP